MPKNLKPKERLGNDFPSPLVSNKRKESKTYGLAYANKVEERWFNAGANNTNQFYAKKRQIRENRKYAQGNQNPAIYKKWWNPTGDTSWVSLDFSPIAIIPKYLNILANTITESYWRISAEAIDPKSKTEKDKERNRLMTKMMVKDVMAEFSQIVGQDFNQKGFTPENTDELDFHMNTNFKMAVEIAVEEAIEYTFQLNNFRKETFKKIVWDILTIGIGGCKVDTDPQRGVTQTYVDPENTVYSNSDDPYFKDVAYFATVKRMTISDIRRVADIEEKKLAELAKSVQGDYGNSKLDRWDTIYQGAFDTDAQIYKYAYDDFKVEVLDFEFKTVDTHTYEEQTSNSTGRKYFKKIKDGYKPQNKDKRANKRVYDKYEMWYGGYKVLSKDIIWGYGRKKNIPRSKDEPNKASSSFKMIAPNLYDNEYTSVLQFMKPYADGMMRSWLKIQQIQQKQRPPGLKIDVDALGEVDLGTGKLNPLQLADYYNQTGDYHYSSKDYGGMNINPNPIQEIVMSYQGLINDQITIYNQNLSMIQSITGMNPIRDASAPNPETGLGQAQIALQMSNNATRHYGDAAYHIVEEVSSESILRLQDIFEYSDKLKSMYADSIGKNDVANIEMLDKMPLCNFGIAMDIDLTDDEKASLNQDIQIALQSGQITLDDKYMIEQMNNMKDARRYLGMRIKKRDDARKAEEQEKIVLQGEQIQKQTMAASQAKQQELQMELQMKLQYEQTLHGFKMEQIALMNEGKINEEVVRGQFDLEEERIQAGAKVDSQNSMEDRKDKRMREEKSIQSELIEQQKSDNPSPKSFTDSTPSLEDLLPS